MPGMRRTVLWTIVAAIAVAVLAAAPAARADTFKVGVLKFGTVNWLMDVIQLNKLDDKAGYRLEQVELAGRDATSVALLAGAVDTIVLDWFWALRERAAGERMAYYPYSRTVGSLMVKGDGSIAGLADLKGKKIGVAGGPYDKSWLLLRARSKAAGAGDPAETAEAVYGAPPLLAEQLIRGEIDAALIYWNYAAKLEAAGFRELVSVDTVTKELGLDNPPPLIGFVFREPSDAAKAGTLRAFTRSLREASALLVNSDAAWEPIRGKMGVDNEAEFVAMRDRFRAGQLAGWNPSDTAQAETMFKLLAEAGGENVTGAGVGFDPAVFAPGLGLAE